VQEVEFIAAGQLSGFTYRRDERARLYDYCDDQVS